MTSSEAINKVNTTRSQRSCQNGKKDQGKPDPSSNWEKLHHGRGTVSFFLLVRDGGLNIVHPEDRVEELNLSRQMAACLDNDDDPEAQQSLIVN